MACTVWHFELFPLMEVRTHLKPLTTFTVYVTLSSRLPLPVFNLWLFCWKPAVVDQLWTRDEFFLDGSSALISASLRGRPAREGSLLRRTWRGISVERSRENKEDINRLIKGKKWWCNEKKIE